MTWGRINLQQTAFKLCGVGFLILGLGIYWLASRGDTAAPLLSIETADSPPAHDLPIAGGTYLIGHPTGSRDASPTRKVTLSPFRMERTEVTNAMFAQFVKATGYRTDAERRGSSLVFDPSYRGFRHVEGANWRTPLGEGSSIVGKEHHPVVQVSWYDANAYATWAGKALPSEFQWEAAARVPGRGKRYPWTAEDNQPLEQRANLWQGEFPVRDEQSDGFGTTAPVGSFPLTGPGFADLCGNVAEWTASWYAIDSYDRIGTRDPDGPTTGTQRVVRGGSWISSDQTGTSEAMIWYRMKLDPEMSNNFTGFRCVSFGR